MGFDDEISPSGGAFIHPCSGDGQGRSLTQGHTGKAGPGRAGPCRAGSGPAGLDKAELPPLLLLLLILRLAICHAITAFVAL